MDIGLDDTAPILTLTSGREVQSAIQIKAERCVFGDSREKTLH